ncbi:MAG: beta strand repeat-containing protein, partial [Chitinophagales bacterium]
MKKNYTLKVAYLLILPLLAVGFVGQAQTTLVDPTGAGGFELGTGSFADNGWTVVNGSGVTNQWFTGTAPSLFTSRSAYVSNDPTGSTHNYLTSSGSLVHFYRDITLPAGQTSLSYSYQWYGGGESTYDFIQISVGSTSITPAAQSGTSGSVSPITTPIIAGTTVIGAHNLQTASIQNVSGTVSSANFGNCSSPATIRLFITWRNDGSGGTQPPSAIDNFSLISSVPASSPLSGTVTVGPTGTYPTLTAAVNAVNQSGVSAATIIELQATYTGAGEVFPIVLAGQTNCSPPTSTNTVTIRPELGSPVLTISSSTASQPAIDINGGQWWRIDGRPGGVGTSRNLIIASTVTTGQVVRFINEGSNNILRFCSLRGVNTSTTSGVVLFSTTSGANGNDNNLVEQSDIRDGATTPVNGIYASGTTTTPATLNSGNTISNNEFINIFGASSISYSINVVGGNSEWTISGNSIYQTVSRSTTTTWGGIQVSNTTSGNNFTVSGNYIGGTAPLCGGTPLTFTGAAVNFRGINIGLAGSVVSTFSNNFIQNINITTTNTAGFNGGILAGQGLLNISNNTIGSASTTGNITISASGSAYVFSGIICGGLTPASLMNLTGNTIAGISLTVTGTPATVPTFRGISVQGTATGVNYNVSNNSVGSTTVPGSITYSGNSILTGIITFCNAVGQTFNSNTVANMVNSNTGTNASAYGMQLQGSGTSPNFLGTFTATNNLVRDISTASASATFVSAAGLTVSGTAQVGGSNLISQNTIHSISNTNATAVATIAFGAIFTLPTTTTNLVERNFIHSISLSNTAVGAANGITGFQVNGGNSTYQNNKVRVGINAAGTAVLGGYTITGITEAAGSNNFYNNSVYVGGAAVTGTNNSFAFRSLNATTPRNYRSNIFLNNRSNGTGTGKHYAINLVGTAPNPAGVYSENNLLLAPGTGGFVGLYNALDQASINDWRSATGNDLYSLSSDPLFVAPDGSASSVDLHIQPSVATPVEANGAAIPGVSTDFDGQTRSGLTASDIGADAGNFTPLSSDLTPPGIAFTALASNNCGAGNIDLTGVAITDQSGVPTMGALVPRIYYRKNTGTWFSKPGTISSGTSTNGTWTFSMVVSDLGGVSNGDIVSYYVIAQDIATTPNIGSFAPGVVATDVNSVSAHPVAPQSSSILVPLSGTYTVGAGGNYSTIASAIAAYNLGCINGPVTFSLTDATYTETLPLVINGIPTSNSTNTLTIKPATGVNAVISGSSTTSIFTLNGADWVTIDGSNGAGTNSVCPASKASRNLSIINTSTAASTTGLFVSSSAINPATNLTIKNCTIQSGVSTTATTYGIAAGGATIGSTGFDIDNLTIENNSVSKAYNGISVLGTNNLPNNNDNLAIRLNDIGSSTVSDYITNKGIDLSYSAGAQITANTIFNITTTTTATNSVIGIDLGAGMSNSVISKNTLDNILQPNPGGWTATGIVITSTTAVDNILLSNNIINNVRNTNWSTTSTINPFGIRLNGGTNTKIYNNTVVFDGAI